MKKSIDKLVFGLSFGERYFVASLIYLGMSFILIATMPEAQYSFAQSGDCSHTITVTPENGSPYTTTVSGCPDGQSCCGGSCIGAGQGCCNGTPYNTETQGCCNGKIHSKSTEGCCSGKTYNIETEKCCADGTTASKECCCEE